MQIRLGSGSSGSQGGATTAARVIGSFVFGLFLLLGSFLTLELAEEAWQEVAPYRFARQPVEILRVEVEERGGENRYLPVVEFQYLAEGSLRTSRTLAPGNLATGRYSDAQARIAPYRVGMTTGGLIGPSGQAFLEHGRLWYPLIVLFPLIFVAIGLGGLVFLWKPKPKDAQGREIEAPISESAPGKAKRSLGVLGGALVLVGVGSAWPLIVSPARNVIDAQAWTASECVVERSAVKSHESDDGTTYSVDIRYRWEHGGTTHRSDRYSFFGGSSSGREGKAEVVRAHPPGRVFTCWVDPEDPSQAVIERGVTLQALMALIPIVFLTAGVLILRAGRRQSERRARMESSLLQTDLGPGDDDPILEWLPSFEWKRTRHLRKPETGPAKRLFGVIFACLFWNGIVAVFLDQAIASHERGRPEWGLTVFLVPFVLVGVGLVFAILYEVLRATNARVDLHFGGAPVMLGETLEIDWQLRGRADRVRRLTLVLEGKEQATYRRGTNTYTSQEVFCERSIVSLTGSQPLATGRASVEIPRDTMHSFEAPNNKIEWAIHVKGEIARWPDIDARYPVVVLPLPPGERAKPEETP